AAQDEVDKYFKTMTVLSQNCFDTDSDAMKAWNLTKFGVLNDKTDLGMEIEFRKSLLNQNIGKSFQGITRLIKNGAVKMGIRPRLPKLEFKRKLYLKKLYKTIDRDLLYEILDKVNAKQEYKMEDLAKDPQKADEEELYGVPKELYYDVVKKEFKPYFVSTRMLSTTNVKLPKDRPSFMTTLFGKMEEPVKYRDSLILHIHGGGFVGSSTFGSEMFLRQWTNNLNIPILGIDYCLSPENQYPSALNDCWQAYHWILNNAEKEFAIKPKRIILSGNDAGGNLALALTYLLIATGQRVPDLLLSIYPVCDLHSKNMTTSLLKGFDENYLSPASMLYASYAYRGDYENDEDCFLNLWKANESILKKMPKTRMFLADLDPLRDAALKTAAKIAKSAPDFKVYDFEGLKHGFLKEKDTVLSGVPNKIICDEIEEYTNAAKANEKEEPEEEYVPKKREYPQELLDAMKQEEELKKAENK
ncbi:MAG: alpha/beta hydrolase, partial [archaeon]|nr:alpha/beta hydrolase [archaeon]